MPDINTINGCLTQVLAAVDRARRIIDDAGGLALSFDQEIVRGRPADPRPVFGRTAGALREEAAAGWLSVVRQGVGVAAAGVATAPPEPRLRVVLGILLEAAMAVGQARDAVDAAVLRIGEIDGMAEEALRSQRAGGALQTHREMFRRGRYRLRAELDRVRGCLGAVRRACDVAVAEIRAAVDAGRRIGDDGIVRAVGVRVWTEGRKVRAIEGPHHSYR